MGLEMTDDGPTSPALDLRHLHRMTSSFGLWQHASGALPDRRFGFCTDDNARALIAAIMHYQVFKDSKVFPLAERYLTFVEEALDPETLCFRNFRSAEGEWLESEHDEDAHGRALWSVAFVLELGQREAWTPRARRLFDLGVKRVDGFKHPRPWALAILAFDHALRGGADSPGVRQRLLECARLLQNSLQSHVCDGWYWFEDQVTYANAQMPHALARAGFLLDDAGMVREAAIAMRWLVEKQLTHAGALTIVGNDGWMKRRGHRAYFDQQPIDAMCLVQAACALADMEDSVEWRNVAQRCYRWFVGENDLGLPMIDPDTGGCFDGLTPSGVNTNQGAESLLSWLIAYLTIHNMDQLGGV